MNTKKASTGVDVKNYAMRIIPIPTEENHYGAQQLPGLRNLVLQIKKDGFSADVAKDIFDKAYAIKCEARRPRASFALCQNTKRHQTISTKKPLETILTEIFPINNHEFKRCRFAFCLMVDEVFVE